jgi:hypothetical protein
VIGISSTSKETINKIVEQLFDRIALQFIGNIPRLKEAKRLIISSQPHFGLSHLFIQAMLNRKPNEVESDVLKSILLSADGYIQSLKNKTQSNLVESLDGLARTAKLQDRKISQEEVQSVLDEEFKKAGSHLKLIAESESTKFRNLGTAMDITKVASSIGDDDPTVFFIMVRDNVTCRECIKIHTVDGITPRLFKLSQLKSGYHKRGEDSPSFFGLHPHCFTEDMKLHTSEGLISIKELFLSQSSVTVCVDKRIANRKYGNNQYGKIIAGQTWLDRHKSGVNLFNATNVYDTGVQNCLKITLSNGFSISVSEGHEMWVDDDKNGLKIQAKELKINDKIPLISGECGFGTDHFPELAELMGNLMGDGSISNFTAQWNFFGNDIPYGKDLFQLAKKFSCNMSAYNDELTIRPPDQKYNVNRATFNSAVLKNIFKNDFNLSKKPRQIPERLWKASKETVSAFLRGLYAADGCSEKSPSVVIAQNDLEFLKEIQLLLSNFGLISSIKEHGKEIEKEITYSNGDTFLTKRKPCWRLILGGWDQCAIFAKEIGFGVPEKQRKLREFLTETEGKIKHGSWRTSRIISIESIGKQQTYCLTEPITNTVTVNGFVTGQCRCTMAYLSKSFGFNEKGKLKYISENYDAYAKQR